MHEEPKEVGVFVNTELVLHGVCEIIVSEIDDPTDAVPSHQRRIYVYGTNGDVMTIILRAMAGRRATDLAISYCGAGSVLAS